MSRTLNNGYKFALVNGTHKAGGEPVDSFRDAVEKTILVADDGECSRAELVDRAVEAVDDSFIASAAKAAKMSRNNAIEILHELTFRVPVVPDTQAPRLPYARPSGA